MVSPKTIIFYGTLSAAIAAQTTFLFNLLPTFNAWWGSQVAVFAVVTRIFSTGEIRVFDNSFSIETYKYLQQFRNSVTVNQQRLELHPF